VGGKRWKKSDSAEPFVEIAVRAQAVVTAIVADYKQAPNHKTHSESARQFQPDRFDLHNTCEQH
jgi:hypothetical protein